MAWSLVGLVKAVPRLLTKLAENGAGERRVAQAVQLQGCSQQGRALGECALCSLPLKGKRNTYAWQISPKMYFSKTPDCLASSAAAGKFQREKRGKEGDFAWGGGGERVDCVKEGNVHVSIQTESEQMMNRGSG